MPLITLTMSLGADEVKTARHGEPSFIFRNRNKINHNTKQIPCDYDEQSFQDKKLDPIGKASIAINRRNEPPIHIERDTFCYTYDVFMCQPTSNNEEYDPKEVYSSPEFIGQVTVPSIHHFPHFFKLFVNQNNQIENQLRGTTWHIVDDTAPHSLMMRSQQSIQKHGMIPRDVFDPLIRNKQYRNIHTSTPQFDPVNGFTQHATQDASQIERDRTAEDNEEAHLSAVEKGLTLTQLRPLGSPTITSPTVSFPRTALTLCEEMNDLSDFPQVTIPDAASFCRHEAQTYNQQWDFLFQFCVAKKALTCFSPRNDADEKSDADVDFVSGERRAHWARLKVVTCHLVPNHAPNTVFDSILVMFRYLKESDVLHSLGVFFLKGWIGSNSDMSDEGVHLMKRWCYVLATQYHLKRVQIFPSFIVTDLNECSAIPPHSVQKLESFIAVQNRLVGQFEAKGEVDAGDIGLPAMTASAAPILARFTDLQVNHNPHAVRCASCGSLVTENFPDHCCAEMQSHIFTIPMNYDLIHLVYSNTPNLLSAKEHIEIERQYHLEQNFFLETIFFEETPQKTGKAKKKGQSPEPNTVKMYVGFVKTRSVKHKKASSGLWPTMQSPSHQNEYVEVTCTSVIPDTPDVYRLPFPPPLSALRRTESTSNDVTSHITSTQQASGSPNALSNIIDAHCLWSGRFRMSYEQVGNCRFKLIKLDERPFQSLEYDVPSVDITNHKHNAQFMLPAVPNASVDPLVLYPMQVADPLRSKRIEEESFWEWLNCMNPPAGMSDALQTDETEMTERTTTVSQPTRNTPSMLPAVPCARIGALDVSSEAVTDYLRSKRVEYEYFWQWLNRKNPPARMGDALQADENELIERTQNCGNEIEKSRLMCLLAKGLLRSRLSLHEREIDTARNFLQQSKQHMVLNDTAEVEYELMLASDSVPEISSRGSDELDRIIMNARNCFGINWEQWIEEGHNLPILLNPCFHVLQAHLKQVHDHVNTLRSQLNSIGVAVPMTDECRRAMMENALLQTLKEGLGLQLLIAWKSGSKDQLACFQTGLDSTFQNEGDTTIRAMTTPFRSQENQIGDLDIDCVLEAIGNVLNTTRNHCDTWHALVREHQHTLSSEPRHSEYFEGTGSTQKVWMMIGDNISVSDAPPIHTSVQSDIRMNAQLLIDRLSAIIAVCHRPYYETDTNATINALFEMIAELSPFLTTTFNLDADVGNIENTSSRVMGIDGLKGEAGFPEEPCTTFDGKDFGKQKRTDKTDSGPYDAPSKAEKRMQISQPSSEFSSSLVDLPNREDLSSVPNLMETIPFIPTINEPTRVKWPRLQNETLCKQRQETIKQAFRHAWACYTDHAWGHDEVRPISKKPHDWLKNQGTSIIDSISTMMLMGLNDEAQRAIDWTLNEYSVYRNDTASLFETGIRILAGLLSAYDLTKNEGFLEKAHQIGLVLIQNYEKNSLSSIPDNKCNINKPENIDNFKKRSKEILTRKSPTSQFFNPSYTELDLDLSKAVSPSDTSGSASIAELGLWLEFIALSDRTGDPIFSYHALRALQAVLRAPRPAESRIPIRIKRTGKEFQGAQTTIGSMGDSFYEYLLKEAVYLDGSEEIRLRANEETKDIKTADGERKKIEEWEQSQDNSTKTDKTQKPKPKHQKLTENGTYVPIYPAYSFAEHWVEVMGYFSEQVKETRDGLFFIDDSQSSKTWDHLSCFVGGNFAFGAFYLNGWKKDHLDDNSTLERFFSIGENVTDTCAKMYSSSPTGLSPEVIRFTLKSAQSRPDPQRPLFDVKDKRYLLRPEVLESLFYLFRFTGDTKYQDEAWAIFEAIEKYSKLPGLNTGYTSLIDAYQKSSENNATDANRDDEMPSFLFSETFKYLYLIFCDPATVLPLDQWVLTTEGHPLMARRFLQKKTGGMGEKRGDSKSKWFRK
ncbi:putative Mannosyl-oligosaccharide 1,2-alpha-mannosidase MNS2 [Blattamonas nauphoetae]|uniref:alpha-1,2-Mannosidase n=1 Tax=Blattamonas nauphoetae TaxID=2049346 RepID=A0ABQ9WX79_9EUKA|nr:putative Mannosyl-oligosaccharide 1,2-alpha-mannosidase MNS2 [Blattamonas nauphoetae]